MFLLIETKQFPIDYVFTEFISMTTRDKTGSATSEIVALVG